MKRINNFSRKEISNYRRDSYGVFAHSNREDIHRSIGPGPPDLNGSQLMLLRGVRTILVLRVLDVVEDSLLRDGSRLLREGRLDLPCACTGNPVPIPLVIDLEARVPGHVVQRHAV